MRTSVTSLLGGKNGVIKLSESKQTPPTPPPPGSDPLSLAALGVLVVVVTGVIVLIVSAHLAPAIAVTTVTCTGYVAVEVAQKLLGFPPTRLGEAIGTGVKSFLGALSPSRSASLTDVSPDSAIGQAGTKVSTDTGETQEDQHDAAP
jgi:hypothetical protein